MPLNQESQALLDAFAEAGAQPFEEMTVPAARAVPYRLIDLQGDATPLPSVADRSVPGPAGAIPVRIFTPPGPGPLPVIVYFHGGGWVLGDLEIVDKPCRRLAAETGAMVVSVDYRRAPEHRYPAAFDDCFAVTAWVSNNAAELGIDASRLAVLGDSAGGNLAAAVALAARDRGGPGISAQVLIYPALDFNFDTASYREFGDGYFLTKGAMQWFWAHYLGEQDPDKDPYVWPARSENLTGLPPTYVATAEFDPLRDEGESYGQALSDAGVEVTVRRFDSLMHGFFWTLAAIPSGEPIFDDIATALEKAWSS